MAEFERQNEMMGMKEEMINEAIDEAMADEDDEAEMDAEVSKVVDEMMMDVKAKIDDTQTGLTSVPTVATGDQQVAADSGAATTEEDKELEARLAALKTAMN